MATLGSDPLADETDVKAEEEQLRRAHMGFARAFKLNDAAVLLPFLDKNVTLTTHDGHHFSGPSAVLGYLVGAKMSKLSGALHVKGRPTRRGAWQSAFVYEHGLVFREPLYSEVVDWIPHTSVATRITHTRLSSLPEPGPPKNIADVVKVVAAIPHRLSLSDDDDCSTAPTAGRRSSLSRSSLMSAPAVHSPTSAAQIAAVENGGAIVSRIAVTTKLAPIRKRKLVNAFLTVESDDGLVLWKSTVAKKQTQPVWNGIDLEFPPPLDDEEGVVVTLWDHSFFRSLRVAHARVTGAELLRQERGGIATLELKPMGFTSSPVELTVSVTRLNGERDWRPRRMSVVSNVAAVDAAMADYDDAESSSSTAVITKRGVVSFTLDVLDAEGPWFVATSALGVLLMCAALLWLHSSGQLLAN